MRSLLGWFLRRERRPDRLQSVWSGRIRARGEFRVHAVPTWHVQPRRGRRGVHKVRPRVLLPWHQLRAHRLRRRHLQQCGGSHGVHHLQPGLLLHEHHAAAMRGRNIQPLRWQNGVPAVPQWRLLPPAWRDLLPTMQCGDVLAWRQQRLRIVRAGLVPERHGLDALPKLPLRLHHARGGRDADA